MNQKISSLDIFVTVDPMDCFRSNPSQIGRDCKLNDDTWPNIGVTIGDRIIGLKGPIITILEAILVCKNFNSGGLLNGQKSNLYELTFPWIS
jgi:hypothetical protein